MADQEGAQLSMADAIRLTMNADANVKPPAQEPKVEEPAAAPPAVEPIAPTLPVATAQVEPIAEPAPAAVPAFNELEWIKKTFGEDIDSVDTIKAKLNAPAPEPTFQTPTFENENSKKIYEALLHGKENEVADYLSKKQFVSSLKEKSPEEIVKAGWKTEYGLTDKEADRKFTKQYQVDELLEDEDKTAEEKIVAKQIEKEADKYKTFFSQYEQEIKLPSIETPAPASAEPPVDYTSEAAKKAIAFSQQFSQNVSNDIGFEFADNSLKLKGQVNIPTEEVAKIKTQVDGHEDKLIEALWFKDGFNSDAFASDMYYLANKKTIVNAAVSQAIHQARIEWLKENRNHKQPGAVITGDFAPSEDEQKREWYRKNMM